MRRHRNNEPGLTPPARRLTAGEIALAAGMFRGAIEYGAVRVHRRKWAFFQPRHVVMAPCGDIHFHPDGMLYQPDFAAAPRADQGLFIHEMTHVWQAQRKGRLYLPLMRHPFCRYGYDIVPGRAFGEYGLEQQAEIVRHAFLLRQGGGLPGKPELAVYEALLPFGPARSGGAGLDG